MKKRTAKIKDSKGNGIDIILWNEATNEIEHEDLGKTIFIKQVKLGTYMGNKQLTYMWNSKITKQEKDNIPANTETRKQTEHGKNEEEKAEKLDEVKTGVEKEEEPEGTATEEEKEEAKKEKTKGGKKKSKVVGNIGRKAGQK
ncbi:uncharacterized protein [Bemisia tabaci]|uniref:uncharacterized protein n=1 Tax=Bemisia tabaci TaxID=7038 RepID=UPI003B288787